MRKSASRMRLAARRWLGRITGAGAVMGVSVLAAVVMAAAVGITGQRVEPTLQQRYEMLPELPTTASDAAGIADTAVALAAALDAVPADATSGRSCPPERLAVSWEQPRGYEVGTLVEPVGPAPDDTSTAANGVVVCEGSAHAFMGFEAVRRGDGSWLVTAVPMFVEDHLAEVTGHLDLRYLLELRYLDDEPLALGDLGPVDPYAPYQPQRLCHPEPKPGMVAMARLLLDEYPETGSFGISRGCDLGPRSEHKEGRAFDWAAHVRDPAQRAAVEDLLSRLLATDGDGNRHALARRMGVMYLIWNGHIWSSYRAADGWRPYGGPSAHTDHVHVSLSWDGAMGQTSLWQVRLDELDLGQLASPGALVPGEVHAIPDDVLARTDPPYVLALGDDPQAGGDGTAEGDGGATPEDGQSDEGGPVADLEDGVYDLAELLEQDPADTVEDLTGDVDETVEDTTGQVGDAVEDTTADLTEDDGDGGEDDGGVTDGLQDTVSDATTGAPAAP